MICSDIQDDELYLSILPTATQYARNAIFAGLMPSEIEARFPKLWLNDEDEGGKNKHEEEFFHDTLKRHRKEYKHSYTKVTNNNDGKNWSTVFLNYYKTNSMSSFTTLLTCFRMHVQKWK